MTELQHIGRFKPVTPKERADWDRLTAFLDRSGVRAFSRYTQTGGHVTGSAFVLAPDLSAVLLTHHRKLDRWLQLGGHCDGICDARAVAMKEAQEESGLGDLTCLCDDVWDIDIHEIPARGSEPSHLHYDVRFLFQAHSVSVKVSSESKDLCWVPLEEVHLYAETESVLRPIRKILTWRDQTQLNA